MVSSLTKACLQLLFLQKNKQTKSTKTGQARFGQHSLRGRRMSQTHLRRESSWRESLKIPSQHTGSLLTERFSTFAGGLLLGELVWLLGAVLHTWLPCEGTPKEGTPLSCGARWFGSLWGTRREVLGDGQKRDELLKLF